MMRYGDSDGGGGGVREPAAALGGGATSHVLLEPVLRFSPTAGCVCYDDAARVLLAVDGDAVHITPLDSRLTPAASAAPRLLRLDGAAASAASASPPLCCRLSLDGRLLALQKSPVEVILVSTATGASFALPCRPGSSILGLFWTQSAGSGCEFVLGTTNGLELYAALPGGAGLRLLEEKRKPGCQWMAYTHETRVCLLGHGAAGNKLFGFQFSSSSGGGASPLRLPKAELPAPNPGWPPVGPTTLKLLAMYGRLFCAQIDEQGSSLVLYRFYRDALLRQYSFPLPDPHVALSVIDNALVIHAVGAGVALVLDILSSSSQPLAPPLPLGRAPAAGAGRQGSSGPLSSGRQGSLDRPLSLSLSGRQGSAGSGGSLGGGGSGRGSGPHLHSLHGHAHGDGGAEDGAAPPPRDASPPKRASGTGVVPSGVVGGGGAFNHPTEHLEFLPGDLVLDRGTCTLCRLRLDLNSLAASCSERPVLVGFLQRRREPLRPSGPPSAGAAGPSRHASTSPHALTLAVVRAMLQERDCLPDLGRTFDVLAAACATLLPDGAQRSPSSGQLARLVVTRASVPKGSPAVSPDELLHEIFLPAMDEMHGTEDRAYLRSALVELLRSTDYSNIAVPAECYRLLTELILADGGVRPPHLWYPLLLPPPSASGRPAGSSGSDEPAQVLSNVMSVARRQGDPHLLEDAQLQSEGTRAAYVRDLLAHGKVLQALRFVRRHRVENVAPAVFMDVAAAQDDPCVFAAAYRFCSNFVPGFSLLPDYAFYTEVLQAGQQPVAARAKQSRQAAAGGGGGGAPSPMMPVSTAAGGGAIGGSAAAVGSSSSSSSSSGGATIIAGAAAAAGGGTGTTIGGGAGVVNSF